MNTQRWKQVKDILDRALDVPEAEVRRFLESACGGDGDLRREVDSLLSGRAEAEDFIETPVLRLSFPEEEPEAEPKGTRFGAYEVCEILGRGGMGTVYLAQRADGAYEAQAAVKILHRGMDTDEIVRRFEAERQILASLRHPYIAELLDGGSTDDGRPFLVMEYIEGTPIDQFCDRRKWTLRQRLELFLRVCRAVEHAHRAMVVHRDLKPANILVLEDGTPKLLDFGIAKLLEVEAGTAALTQGTGPRIFTPGYASPEQLRGEAVGAASDTYSLGVLLYELLTGRRPYPVPDMTPERAGDTLEKLPIERPSTAVRRPYRRDTAQRGSGAASETLAAEELSRRRAEEPRSLQRRLAGDLDNILLKALRPEPHERYASVADLARDIRAHLEDRPVLARQGTLRYRAGKFAQRHRIPLAILGGLLLLLSYGGWQQWTAQQERRRAEEQQARTAVESRKAQAVEDFLIEIFVGSDPENEQWKDARLSEVLDRGAEILPQRLELEPEVKANLISIIGRVYQKGSDIRRALPRLQEALELRRATLGEDHELVAYSKIHLGLLQQQRNQLDEAEKLTREALGTLRDRPGEVDQSVVAAAENNLGLILKKRGKLAEAEALFRQTLETKRRAVGPESDEFAIGLHNLASVVVDLGRGEEAEALYRQAIELRRRIGNERTISMTRSLGNLGVLLTDSKAFGQAEPLLREALAIRRDLLGGDHRYVGVALNNLGLLYLAQDRYEEAEATFGEGERIFRENPGEDSYPFAVLICNQARLDLKQERWSRAEGRARRALAIYQARRVPAWRLADARSLLGAGLAATGRWQEGEALMREAYDSLAAYRPAQRRQTAEARQRLVDFYRRQGQDARAEALLKNLRNPVPKRTT